MFFLEAPLSFRSLSECRQFPFASVIMIIGLFWLVNVGQLAIRMPQKGLLAPEIPEVSKRNALMRARLMTALACLV